MEEGNLLEMKYGHRHRESSLKGQDIAPCTYNYEGAKNKKQKKLKKTNQRKNDEVSSVGHQTGKKSKSRQNGCIYSPMRISEMLIWTEIKI